MSLLTESSGEEKRNECLDSLRFWLNSITIHSFNEETQKIASVLIVGTRKDQVTAPSDHEKISKIIVNEFSDHPVWPSVVSNPANAKVCFFPVNNRLSIQDTTIHELINSIQINLENLISCTKISL